ncbi:single-strand binding protein [Desulfacinum hydrothermale DSM 13146]|uniref:Single-stranded DNA-binding protein n=1 Tax=Desulfacinum hydrothermale DSM 13146 TaxID=1121390 RepID=A0A1W1XKM5_9BACT|nr:single-stranded DNA-binding protein [Desulfacinum hydrothermale]SMC24516.1 single-strand binding protein [Desulfacinum hydrothermale DSM 13146]
MAKTMNKVILIGRLGADPDIRYTQSGTAVVRFNLATNERVPAGEGNWEERTEWHRVVVFGRQAEACGNYLAKGRLVYVEGRLRTNQWEDAQGVRRYTTEIVAGDVGFLDSGRDAAAGTQAPQGSYQKAPARSQRNGEAAFPDALPEMSTPPDDDIPF